jgi:AcrR family transcriptional regulator
MSPTETAAADALQDKAPRTSRGERTRHKLLEAAREEFGEKGFYEAAVSGITQRAGVALGTFYTYFNSKEELYRALVAHMGELTRNFLSERIAKAPDRLTAERAGLEAFIEFVREHKNLYRIVMEAQFVAPEAYRAYYDVFAEDYRRNLAAASAQGQIRPGHDEERAWALIGMNVFLGLKYGVWNEDRPAAEVAAAVADLIEHGLAKG